MTIRRGLRRTHDHDRTRGRGEASQKLQPVYLRQIDVKENNVGPRIGSRLKITCKRTGALAIGNHMNIRVDAVLGKRGPDQIDVSRVVFNDQNAIAHDKARIILPLSRP